MSAIIATTAILRDKPEHWRRQANRMRLRAAGMAIPEAKEHRA